MLFHENMTLSFHHETQQTVDKKTLKGLILPAAAAALVILNFAPYFFFDRRAEELQL